MRMLTALTYLVNTGAKIGLVEHLGQALSRLKYKLDSLVIESAMYSRTETRVPM